ncbi:hypothetical protein ACWDTI_21790 [Gordonia sp. NPDC003424]
MSTPTTRPDPTTAPAYEPPDSWIPVDKRRFGMDSRTILPGIVVLVIGLVLAFVPAMIDSSVNYDDPVRAGDVMAVGDRVTFTPATDWDVREGLRTGEALPDGSYPPTATVANGGVAFQVHTAPYSGSPEELLDQIRRTNEALGDVAPNVGTKASAIKTDDGHEGLIAEYEAPSGQGAIAAFVSDGLGVQVVAAAPPEYEHASVEQIARMIQSIAIKGA